MASTALLEKSGLRESPTRRILGQGSTQGNESIPGAPFEGVDPDMKQAGWHEVVLTSEANEAACTHLLQHYRRGKCQKISALACGRPVQGMERETAIVTAIFAAGQGRTESPR